MTENEKAIQAMKVIRKIINANLDDISSYYILKWFESGWRDEQWVDSEIEFRKECAVKELVNKNW